VEVDRRPAEPEEQRMARPAPMLDDAIIACAQERKAAAAAGDVLEDVTKLRARLCALELVVAQLVADLLEQNPDPAATANDALRGLMTLLETLPVADAAGDERRFRDLTKYAAFDLLQRAVERIGDPV
jgi:hypothetical protein